MSQISNIELENLRHLISTEQLCYAKARAFAQQVSDPQLKSYLEKQAWSAEQSIQNLNQFLFS
ncbi:MAG: hypothetical protein GX175_07285 [Halanaerobiaceae bacterium]|jgi:hypothetical protein|nr:hypothetical protein [Halanaerobiaceae bacterium]